MKLAHILICHSYDPTPLFKSIPHHSDATWYIFMHQSNRKIETVLLENAYARNARLYLYGENRGIARSWNEGIFDAMNNDCEAFVLLNDDIVFYDGKYDEFVHAINVVSKALDVSYITTLGFEPYMDRRTVPQHFACCALTRHCVDAVGCFDENFFPAYHEDVDYYVRSFRLGFHPHVEMRPLVEHRRGGTAALLSSREQAELNACKAECEAYFNSKWSENPWFPHPFNDPTVSFSIPFSQRGSPYRGRYDRQILYSR